VRTPLRRDRAITVFDGTGLALQDLAVANLFIEAAQRSGVAQAIAF
jgi:ornithine cyclodeaminase/alanine dehydrogenase-like protein (mu-crystallin family)